MKVTFHTGKRYRVRVRLPAAISPKLALVMLQSSLANVIIGDVVRGVVTAEATWRDKPKVVTSDFIIEATELQTSRDPVARPSRTT